MAPNIEKRTVSSAHAPDLDSDRLAVQELEPLLELGNDQGWFKERLYLIHILYDEITTYDHAVTRPWTITRSYQRTASDLVPKQLRGQQSTRSGRQGRLLVGADGLLMPVWNGQARPDLRHFE